MTANAARRQRITRAGAAVWVLGVVAAVVVAAIAVVTLRDSNEGRAPEADLRPIVAFPSTPNLAVGVVDDLDRLTSLAVMTLDPSGIGGSVVVVPINVDANNGFGPDRRPISRQPFSPGSEEQTAQLVSELELVLTLTIQRGVVLGPDDVEALVEPYSPLEVDLPERVVDADTAGSGIVAAAGERMLESDVAAAAFTAISLDGDAYSHHDVDVSLWTSLAAAATESGRSADVPTDEFDRPLAPESSDDFLARLLGGDVAARDLAIDTVSTAAADNEAGADFVLADRRDALLVFGSISPGLVSTPNEAPAFKLVVGFSEDDVAALGVDASGTPVTKASMTRRFIGELLFEQANIVAVDLADTPESVPERTQLFVVDESRIESVKAASARFFSDADVQVADVITDGADVVVVLGADFLVRRAELIEIERAAAEEGPDDRDADFDVSAGDDPATSDEPTSSEEPAAPADTVEGDG